MNDKYIDELVNCKQQIESITDEIEIIKANYKN